MLLSKWKYVTEEVCDVCLNFPFEEQRTFIHFIFFNNRWWRGHKHCIEKAYEDFYNYEKAVREDIKIRDAIGD